MSRITDKIPFAGKGILGALRFVSGLALSVSGAAILLSDAIQFLRASV